MEQPRSRREQQERANRIFLWAFGGLMLLTAVVVLVSSFGSCGSAPVSNAAITSSQAPPATEPAPLPAAVATPEPAPKPEPQEKVVQPEPAPKPAPEKPKQTSNTVVDQMAKVPSGSRQIIIITGDRIGSNTGVLSVYNKEGDAWVKKMSTEANFGKNGLIDGEKRHSGNLETPTGVWYLGNFNFGLHPDSQVSSKMSYRQIKNNSYWSSVRDSTYNSWVDHAVSGEHLITADPQYEYAVNSGYNSDKDCFGPNKERMGAGTAIFIHCFEPPGNRLGKFTHGCIAIHREQMIKLFKILDPDLKPTCAIGTEQKGTSTSIWAY